MISDRGLRHLRIAATVIHLHPALGLRLTDAGRTVARVAAGTDHRPGLCAPDLGRPGTDDGPASVRTLTPCAFRGAVARAWARHRAGDRLQLLDLTTEPTLELLAAPGDEAWPSGIVRVRSEEVVTYSFGTFLGPDRCRAQGRDLVDGVPAPDGLLDLVLRRDSDTEVTVVSAEVDPAVGCAGPVVLDILEGLLARFVATELLDGLTREPTRP